MTKIRTYSELITLPTFRERFQYLKLDGRVGVETFGFDRYLNQLLYTSQKWRKVRDKIIIRDNGCDLGVEGYELYNYIQIHHMNPVTVEDIRRESELIFEPEFLICTSRRTHNAIHYGDETKIVQEPIIRTKNDTCPWRLT